MIVTTLDHLTNQVSLTPAMQTALDYLKKASAEQEFPGAEFKAGRVEVDGSQVYALFQEYETLPIAAEVKFEAHHNYIDIQFILTGVEVMGWAPASLLQNPTAYNAEKDTWHGVLPAGAMLPVKVTAGQAAVFYPEDGHAPKLAAVTPGAVKKIVVKVRV
jgi:YhcH/YjgK/YiaL family protein